MSILNNIIIIFYFINISLLQAEDKFIMINCAAIQGVNIAKMVDEYMDDTIPCNPVDEFCEKESSGEIDSEVFVLPEDKLNTMLANNPDISNFLRVVGGQGTGTVEVKVINKGNESTANSKEAEEAAQELKEKMLAVRALLTTIQLADCLKGGTSTQSQSSDPLSAQNLAVTGISKYNPMMGVAIDAAINTYSSLQDIDTCNSESDARDKGERHIATLKAKKYGLCREIRKIKHGSTILDKQTEYRFCCYDNQITKLLVEQAKAQLAHTWGNCTGITLNELRTLKFRSCDPAGLENGVDGTKFSFDATAEDRKSAYQYQNNCIDTRGYVALMLKTFGGDNQMLDEKRIKDEMQETFGFQK